MVDSYNCLRLDDKHVFQVEVYEDNEKHEDNEKQKFFELDNNKKIPFGKLKVGQLANIIACKGNFKVSDISNLWKVDVEKSKINTEDDIRENGGVSMAFKHNFKRYFEANCELTDNIHIVVVITTTATGKCLPMVYLSFSILHCMVYCRLTCVFSSC
jgi:hypothetical protein